MLGPRPGLTQQHLQAGLVGIERIEALHQNIEQGIARRLVGEIGQVTAQNIGISLPGQRNQDFMFGEEIALHLGTGQLAGIDDVIHGQPVPRSGSSQFHRRINHLTRRINCCAGAITLGSHDDLNSLKRSAYCLATM